VCVCVRVCVYVCVCVCVFVYVYICRGFSHFTSVRLSESVVIKVCQISWFSRNSRGGRVGRMTVTRRVSRGLEATRRASRVDWLSA
jgi:hypothetical protein